MGLVASSIVNDDVNSMIDIANQIVRNCVGPNCNFTSEPQIRKSLSDFANQRSLQLINQLKIPSNFTEAATIRSNYSTLANVVSTIYIHQCEAVITNNECTSQAPQVIQQSKITAESLENPINSYNLYETILGLLIFLICIFFILFLLFILMSIVL